MKPPKRKLLIVACSNRKKKDKSLLPAIERYDGVNYRVIKKLRREGRFPKNVDVMILSAQYGLIDAMMPIPYYDLRMDRARASELRDQVTARLDTALRARRYDEIFVNMGKVYLGALDSEETLSNSNRLVKYAEGGIGQKMRAMKEWLINANTPNAG